MPEFRHQHLFEHRGDEPEYRLLTSDHVRVESAGGRETLHIDPEALRLIARDAMDDIAHLLRAGHLEQLRRILDDPEASANDRFVTLELLKNANIAAGRVLPGCQDTGTAIVLGYKGQDVYTDCDDDEVLCRGIFDAYQERNLRYSQMAPLSMYEEKNTGTNLPAQVDLYAARGDEYRFLFIAKGGGSANKCFLYQETKAILNPISLMNFVDEKLRTLGTSACPPYHIALVLGGTSAEATMKTLKLATCHAMDDLPTSGNELGRAFRDLEMERQIFDLCTRIGIGAQFGGKYFAHDVRVIRLPRHGASLPVGLGVSCSADRQILGRINRDGVFLEQLEENPAKYLPEIVEDELSGQVVAVDLNRPMDEIRAELSKYPVATRLSLSGPLIVARDIAHARLKELLDSGSDLPQYFKDQPVYYAGPPKRPEGKASGLVRADDGRPDGPLRRPVPEPRRQHDHAGQGQPLAGSAARLPEARRLLPRLDRRSGGRASRAEHPQGRGPRVRGLGHGGDLADRGRELPRLHRDRRQGQRLLCPVREGRRGGDRRRAEAVEISTAAPKKRLSTREDSEIPLR